MSDRPTPETDAAIEFCTWVNLKVARRLERERDDARDAAEKAKAYKRVMKDENGKLRRELDELNKRLIEASQRGVDLLIERDKAREELEAWKEARK